MNRTAIVIVAVIGVALFVFVAISLIQALNAPLYEKDAVPSSGAAGGGTAAEEVRRLAKKTVAGENLPGVSIAVGVDGKLVYAEGFGYADVHVEKPITPQTRFRLGSASIVLTSAAAGLLHDRGQLDLDAPVQQYLPSFPQKVTTRQAMAHTAGFTEDAIPQQKCASMAEAVQLFANEPLMFAPGTQHKYSRYGWLVVSAVIEAAGKQPFFDFMRNEVFTKLAMNDTLPDGPAVPNRATFYYPGTSLGSKGGLEHANPADYSCYFGAGAFLSTPSDLVRFGLAMQNGTLLKPETVAALQTPVQLPDSKSTNSGLGWTIEETPAGKMVGYSGRSMGGAASLKTYPEHGIVVAVMTNVTHREIEPLTHRVADAFIREKRAARPATDATAGGTASASTAGAAPAAPR